MFEGWDAVVLARAQFAFTMSFHIVFPAFSIGLASYLAVLEALWLWTGREVFINLFNYWLKIFAVAFGMGVVSGIVMSYQFGTNWSAFSDQTGPVLGPLMAYEVLTAFFLEAGFLGRSMPTGSSSPPTGSRPSSIRHFPTASCIWCWRPTSPQRWWSARSARFTCCATAIRQVRG